MAKVLVVAADRRTAARVSRKLRGAGHATTVCTGLGDAAERVDDGYDRIIVDASLRAQPCSLPTPQLQERQAGPVVLSRPQRTARKQAAEPPFVRVLAVHYEPRLFRVLRLDLAHPARTLRMVQDGHAAEVTAMGRGVHGIIIDTSFPLAALCDLLDGPGRGLPCLLVNDLNTVYDRIDLSLNETALGNRFLSVLQPHIRRVISFPAIKTILD